MKRPARFHLQGKHVSYIFAVDAYGHLRHLYFGEQLAVGEDLSFCFRDEDKGFSGNFDGAKDRTASLDTAFLEFPSAGMGDYRRPALLVMTQDGARQTDLRFSSFAVHREKVPPEGLPYVRGGETLEVMLRDDVYGLELSLFYTVFDDQDAVVRSAKLVNRSGGDLRVQKISSFSLDFPDASYDTVCLYGRPCRERMPVREACGPGIREFSSALRGSSSHYLNPFFALVRRETDEHAGDAYGIALVYSGAFSLSAEMTSYGTLRVQGGELYRLAQMCRDGLYAAALVSHDKMHAYVAGITGQTNANVLQKRLKICGLDDARRYRVRETGTVASGRALRTMGLLLPPLRSDFMPVELHLEAEPEKA